MTLYKFGFFYNYAEHSAEMWAISRYEVEKHVALNFPRATGLHIWI